MRFLSALLTPLHRTHAPNFTLQHSNLVPFRPYSCIFFIRFRENGWQVLFFPRRTHQVSVIFKYSEGQFLQTGRH